MTDRDLRPYTEAALHALAASIAVELAGGWAVTHVDPHYGRGLAVLESSGLTNAPVLHLQPSYPDTRLTISGAYPQTHADTRSRHHEISVSATRPPAAIAREITRRLLPVYLADLGKVLAYNANEARNTAARQEFLSGIARMYGQDPARVIAGDGHYHTRLGFSLYPGEASIDAYGDPATVTVTLNGIKAETALTIMRKLGQIPPGPHPFTTAPYGEQYCGTCGGSPDGAQHTTEQETRS